MITIFESGHDFSSGEEYFESGHGVYIIWSVCNSVTFGR